MVDTVAMGEQVSAVAFTPDGKRALAAKNVNNKAAVLGGNFCEPSRLYCRSCCRSVGSPLVLRTSLNDSSPRDDSNWMHGGLPAIDHPRSKASADRRVMLNCEIARTILADIS